MPAVLAPILVVLALAAAIAALVRKKVILPNRERAALAAQHPNEPWMWRRDWADRAVRDTNVVAAGFLWFFGLTWLLMTSPVVWVMRDRASRDPKVLFIFIFPIVGVLVLVAAMYLTLRRRKYGVSLCHLDQLPVSIGNTMRGSIEARLTDMPPDGFRFKLTNLRREVRGSGKNRSVHERVLWQDEQVIRTGAMPNPNGLRIPFSFHIPPDGEAADDRDASNRVIWRLEVAAEVPGIDYKVQFELPVFVTGEVDAWTPEVDPRGWAPGSDSGIRLGVAQNGEEIVIDPRQGIGSWIYVIVFFVIWFGALALVSKLGAPLFFIAIFVLISLVVLLLVGDLLAGRSRLVVGSGYLLTRRTWLGIGPKERRIDSSEIESIKAQVGLTSGDRVYHDVVVKRKTGGTVHVLKHIQLRRDAEMLAAKLRQAMHA